MLKRKLKKSTLNYLKYIKINNIIYKKMKLIFLLCLISLNFINCVLPFFNIIPTKNELSNENKTTYVYGHTNPDTDTICSAIVLAYYLNQTQPNKSSIPGRLGEINKETRFVLSEFGQEIPVLIKDPTDADEVILVDHNNPSQSLDFNKANIVGLIDHHAITGFYTNEPINIITKPIGSTCTILYQLFKSNNIEIPEKIAGLIVSAIISDTLLFRSAVTTSEDENAVISLSNYYKFDYQTLGREILIRGTDVSDLNEEQIINLDAKSYTVNGYKIQIAVLNSVNIDSFLQKRKEKILIEMNKYVSDKKKQLFVFVIIDIFNIKSTALVVGKYSNVVEKAFNVTLVDNQASLGPITSRKKEIYPPIAEQFELLPKYEEEEKKGVSTFIKLNGLLFISLLLLLV